MGRTELAGLGPGLAVRQTALGLVASGGVSGTAALVNPGDPLGEPTGGPLPLWSAETGGTQDTSGVIVVDEYGRLPGWIDEAQYGVEVEVEVPPAGPIRFTLGLTGPKGDKGDTGDTGAAGADGTDGAPGATGSPGAPGTPGATGSSGPPGVSANMRGVWSGATTYAQNDGVEGSDGRPYVSVVNGNLNHDPTTDDGTHWMNATAGAVITSQQSSPVRVTKGITPPASPNVDDLWWSTSVADMRIAPGAGDRVRLLTASQAWENGAVQEPTVWFDGQWNMLYTGGWNTPALGWATCPAAANPLDPANWTKYAGNPIIGQGGNGWAGNVAHSSAYYEAGTLYIYFPDVGGGSNLYVAHGTDPLHLTLEPVAVSTDTPKKWNSRVFKRGPGDYVMFFTASVTGPPLKWNAGLATATSLLGTWTTDTYPIPSLDPVTGAGGTDGPVITLEDGVYVGWYHSSAINQVTPCDIWRATSTDLRNWTILDNGQPVIKRAASYEVDQVADVFLVTTPNGFKFAVWDALDNTVPTSSISAAPLSPVLKRFDGAHWQPVLADSSPSYTAGVGANEHLGMGTLSHVTPDFANTRGLSNTAVGSRALAFLTIGNYNTAFGSAALQVSVTGSGNTALGASALNANTTGGLNTGVGRLALTLNTTGSNNTAGGGQSMQANTTGGSNTAWGVNALFANTTGNTNTAVGYQALMQNTTASFNTALGNGSLQANTTGASNTGAGNAALATNTTGGSNTGLGAGALQLNTTASNNTAAGKNALQQNTTGANNTAMGSGALISNLTGGSNTALGQAALNSTTGSSNTGVGFQAGFQFSSGSSNTALGSAAGNTDGTTATDGTQSSMTLLGEKAQSTLSNAIVLGKVTGTRPNLYYGVVPSTGLISTGNASHIGAGVFFMGNASTNPNGSASPVGGGILYPDSSSASSQLKWKDSLGVTTSLSYLMNGSTTLVAGTKAISNSSITANAVVLVYNISAGGTVGALSVTPNAGTGFTINSTSSTDTSKVFYRVVSY